jgi:hypothetical protein
MASPAGNKKVALARARNIDRKDGKDTWNSKLSKGRIEAQARPSLLRKERLKRLWGQREMAMRLTTPTNKMTESTYQSIERGHRVVDEKRARRIAAVLIGDPNKFGLLFRPIEGGKFVAILYKVV